MWIIADEIYQIGDFDDRGSHVLLRLDEASVDLTVAGVEPAGAVAVKPVPPGATAVAHPHRNLPRASHAASASHAAPIAVAASRSIWARDVGCTM